MRQEQEFTNKVRVRLYEPRHAPIKGMSSYMDAASLDPGWWALLQNIRTDKGVIRVRNGHAKLTSTAINSGSGTFGGAGIINYRGSWTGNPVILAAVEDTGAVEIHASNTGSSFGEQTAAAGAYGNTRMSALSSGDGRVYFSAARDRLTNDNIGVCQNGVDDPRIYSINATVAGLATHYQITTPGDASTFRAKPTFPAYFTVKNGGSTTLSTPTGTSLALADTSGASATENTLTLTATNPVNGDQALVVFSAGISFANSRQFCIVANSNAANFNLWKNVKVEIGDSGGYVVVYDPTAAANSSYGITTISGDNYTIGFNIDAHIASSSNPNIASIDRVRFTWVGSTLSATTVAVTMYVMAASGKVPGNAVHALVYSNQGSKAESIPIYITDVRPEDITNLGGAGQIALNIGNGSQIFYNYVINFLHTTSTERDKGTDKLYLYRKDEDDLDYYYVSTTTLATYAAGWTFSNHGTTTALGLNSLTDSTLAKNYALKAPDPEHIPIPKGKAMLLANGRLWVCGGMTTGSATKLYISEHRYHGRFRETPRLLDDGRPDPVSGTMYPFDGESLQALVASSVGYGGASFTYIFTDKSIYMIGNDVHRIERLAGVGTMSPRSVVEYKGEVYFLDSERKVQVIRNGVLTDISDRLVEDITFAIPVTAATTSRHTKAAASYWGGYYRLAYTPAAGSTNTRCLVWDVEERKWYDDLFAAGTGEELMVWNSAGKEIAVFIGNNLHLYEMEKSGQTTDDSSAIAISLTTNQFKMEDWSKFSIGSVGIICDDVTSGTITVSRYYYPGTGSADTSSISVDVTPNEAWKQDGAITLGNDRRGNRAQLNLSSSTLPGGTNIREIVCELQPRRSGVSK